MGFVYYGQGGDPVGYRPRVQIETLVRTSRDFLTASAEPAGIRCLARCLGLDRLVVDTLDRVELVRGPIETRCDSDFNRGGTLNLVTRNGVARPSVTASAGAYGSWNAGGEIGNYAADARRVSVYSNLGTQGSAGMRTIRVSGTTVSSTASWCLSAAATCRSPLRMVGRSGTRRDTSTKPRCSQMLPTTATVNPTDGGALQHNLYSLRYRVGASAARPLEATFYVGARDWTRWRQDVLLGPTQAQVRQTDDRTTWGYRVEQSWGGLLADRPLLFTVGSALQRADAATPQARTLLREFQAFNDNVDELMTDIGVWAGASGAHRLVEDRRRPALLEVRLRHRRQSSATW